MRRLRAGKKKQKRKHQEESQEEGLKSTYFMRIRPARPLHSEDVVVVSDDSLTLDVTATFGVEDGEPNIWYSVKLGTGVGRRVHFLENVNTADGRCVLNLKDSFDVSTVNNVVQRYTFSEVRFGSDYSAVLDTGGLQEVQRKFKVYLQLATTS